MDIVEQPLKIMRKISKKSLLPATVAPVKRENVATVSRDGNAKMIAPASLGGWLPPFADDDAE